MENIDSDENGTDTINVVPLADLTLVLLIIMMLLAPAVISSMIRVETPNVERVKATKRQKPEKAPDPLLVHIGQKGITLNNSPVDSVEFLGEQIGIKLLKEPERPVIVSADEMIQVGEVVHVLDIAKQNGAQKISLLKGAKS